MNGYKTYALALFGALILGLSILGVIDTATRDALLAAIGIGGLATLRNAIG